MPNYIINECITNNEYILSASSLTSGQIVNFEISETPYCGTVGAVTENPETLNITFIQLYEDCCSCLSGITISEETLNFNFIRCNTLEEINIDATNFCNDYGVPTTGLTYEIQFGSETPFCATFEGLSPTGVTNYFYVSGPFLDCEDCVSPPPISAGTEVFMCVVECGVSGDTVSISPPHPTYLNGFGKAVVQLDAVELGGTNGLNS
jgi:hypothetical protein